MIWWLVLAIGLYVLASILIVAEVFVPSEGLLTVSAVICLMVGGGIFFSYGPRTGVIGIAVAAVLIPTALIIAYNILPKTRFGKDTYLQPSSRLPHDVSPGSEQLEALLGQTGTTLTHLRPVGKCKFDNKKIECSAETGYVAKDMKVKVVRVAGTSVVVRAVEQK